MSPYLFKKLGCDGEEGEAGCSPLSLSVDILSLDAASDEEISEDVLLILSWYFLNLG
ncbi:hypothetical protein D3C80_2014860 [compost metagenome]